MDDIVVAGVTASRGNKSDKRVAYELAEKRWVGNLDEVVFKAWCQFTRLPELSRIHMTLGKDSVRVQARTRSLYRSRGIPVSDENVYGVRRREKWRERLCSSARTRATRLYDHLDFMLEQLEQKEQAEVDLLREVKKHPSVRILETAPVFGPIRAARPQGGRRENLPSTSHVVPKYGGCASVRVSLAGGLRGRDAHLAS